MLTAALCIVGKECSLWWSCSLSCFMYFSYYVIQCKMCSIIERRVLIYLFIFYLKCCFFHRYSCCLKLFSTCLCICVFGCALFWDYWESVFLFKTLFLLSSTVEMIAVMIAAKNILDVGEFIHCLLVWWRSQLRINYLWCSFVFIANHDLCCVCTREHFFSFYHLMHCAV